MACNCDVQGAGSPSWFNQQAPAPPVPVAAPAKELVPEWARELLFSVLVALIVALIMREGGGRSG